MDTPTPEDKYRHELLLSRTVLRNEMRKALHATTPEAKRELVRTWNQAYKPELAKELLRVAKNPEARYRIANWNLEDFDGQRHSKTMGTSSSVLERTQQKFPQDRARRGK